MGIAPRVTTACLIILALAATPRGQTTPTAPPQPTFKAGVDLVALNVAVQTPSSQYFGGLTQSDFAVYEDGVRQDVRFFEASSLPFDLIVLLDASGSMGDKIDLAEDAALGFFDTLRPGDRGAVVAFNQHAQVLSTLTADRAALHAAISGVQVNGRTALNDAVYIALKEFGQKARSRQAVRRQAIAVLSDGKDNASLIGSDDVLTLARETGVNIYAVRLQSSSEIEEQAELTGQARYFTESDFDMRLLARETGGLSFFPMPDRLHEIYQTIAQDLAHQYSIGYEPGGQKRSDGFHRVRVEVINHPELRVRTRLGYTAETSRGTR